jgi:hypothetical protein
MLEEALSQVTCQLPLARDTFESLSKLSPVVIINQISRPMFLSYSLYTMQETMSAKLKNSTNKSLLSTGKKIDSL